MLFSLSTTSTIIVFFQCIFSYMYLNSWGINGVQKINREIIKITPCFYLIYNSYKLSLIRLRHSLKSSFHLLYLKTASYLAPAGSITLECSLVLPLFLFFCVHMMSLISIFCLHSNIEAALHQEVSDAAVKAYAISAGEEYFDLEGSIGTNSVISGAVILGKVKSRLGTEYLNRSLIVDGSNGIHLSVGLPEDDSQDTIDVTLSYSVEPMVGIVGFKRFSLLNRCRMKAWTGYNPADTNTLQKDLETDEMVYVTEYGVVFHRDKECSYLNPSIVAINRFDVISKRNKWGEKYYRCEACGKKESEQIFITTHGNRYHSSKDCVGLKRTINRIPLSEAGGMGPCSRCG